MVFSYKLDCNKREYSALRFWFSSLLWLLCHSGLCVAQNTIVLTFYVSENVTVGTKVGRLQDSDTAQYILTSDRSSPFQRYFDESLLESQGLLVTTNELDHEEYPFYEVVVYDVISTAGNYFQVRVIVTDVNDNYPTFADSVINLEISEANHIGSTFNLDSATDEDSSPYNVQGYRIISGNTANSFTIKNRHVGTEVYADLVVNKTLNREVTSFYSLVIEAYDGDVLPKTGTIEVNINISDVNDNAPVFDDRRYTVHIKEDTLVGRDVIDLNATDRDIGLNSRITYRIDRSQSDPEEFFRVDSETGIIYLNKQLDFETVVQHKIVVEASDSGAQPQVGMVVVIVAVADVNDNEPTINVIFLDAEDAKVSEAAELGDYIARVSVSDPDLGELPQVNMTLKGGNGKFGLQTENNIVYLVCIKQPLDREIQSLYHITLAATDFGSPPQTATTSFTLTIEDVNDNPPRFENSQYNISLKEDAFPGTFVAQLQAKDIDEGINSQVMYSIERNDQSGWFSIHPTSGVITTAQNLNYEVNPLPTIVVVATDQGTPRLSSNATLVVHITDAFDSPPRFEQSSYSVSVGENAAVGKCILQVQANDNDVSGDSSVQYSFVVGSTSAQPTNLMLNTTTGDICIQAALDWETIPEYELHLQATDKAGQWDRTTVYVVVDDVNEHHPTFHPEVYVINVDRNAEVGSPVTQLSADDADNPILYGRISFSLISGNEGGLFKLNSSTGDLYTDKSLKDFEVGTMLELMAVAEDGGGLISPETVNITISVVDGTSAGGPVFSAVHYNFTVDEDAAASTLVGRISAKAIDEGNVKYSLLKDPPNTNWFSVDPISGDVAVQSEMDREIFSSVTFQVVASSGTPPMYGFVAVTVTLNDVNDNFPHIYDAIGGELGPLTVSFTTVIGTLLTTIRTVDNDAGLNGTVRYSMSSALFSIHETTGQVTLISSLPQHSADYRLRIEARDLGKPSLLSTTSLNIRVRAPDVNCPIFPNSNYIFKVTEDFELSKVIGSVIATVLNSTSAVAYRIENSANALPFAIYANGSLYLDASLDREVQDTHQFSVSAQGFPGAVSEYSSSCVSSADVTVTVVDVDDNPPVFSSTLYTFTVKENEGAGTVLGNVTATDIDDGRNAQIIYGFSVPSSKFTIDSQTGFVTSLVPLDFETESDYTIFVEARGYYNMAQTTLRVLVEDVNDNSPIFVAGSQDRLSVISVNSGSGAWVADMRARDADSGENGEIRYLFTNLAAFKFIIDAQTGAISTATSLNQADVGIHTLQVQAEDRGNVPNHAYLVLKVKVQAENTNLAMFDDNQFAFTMLEASEPPVRLGSFAAGTSKRRRRRFVRTYPTYTIISGNDENVFYINETTGDVWLNRHLDYETVPQFSLTVEKRDSTDRITSLSSQFNIRDVNDHTPKFSSGSYSIGVKENTALGKKVWRFTATDQDTGSDGQITYSLLSETPAHAFLLDKDSGELVVDALLDREKVSKYILVINATDGSTTSPKFSTASCVVIVKDVNDNSPQFVSRSETYVMEDEPIGYPLIKVAAKDFDAGANGHVFYTLTSATSNASISTADEMSYFHIDSTTGVVTLAKKLDRERAAIHTLNISATDGASHNPRITFLEVIIYVSDVNDVTPLFEQQIYQATVTEGQSPGVIITKVRAFDSDAGINGQLTYSLPRNSENDPFSIDPSTGVITTNRIIDRERKSAYKLTVIVQDGSFPPLYDWCTVNLTVLDVNDNSPILVPLDTTISSTLVRLDVSEQVMGPVIIFTVAACDRDEGENGKISYSIIDGNSDGDFFLSATSGELWINRSLDRETTSLYQLRVVASDNGKPRRSAESVIEINVLDWNDNNPQFVENPYMGNVNESLVKGQFILTVRANDADESFNSDVRYFLDPSKSENPLEGLFAIDPITGVLTTAAVLDREAQSRHIFSVTAYDSASYGPRNSTVRIEVIVNDVNDNSPIFTDPLIRVNISRSIGGISIAQVTAVDADLNDEVTYSFTNGSGFDRVFNINSLSGSISTASAIPSDFPSQYALFITGSDQGNPSRSSQAVVLISIVGEDSSAEKLLFENNVYNIEMLEFVQKGHFVVQTRLQEGSPSNASYAILSGNENGNIFSISSNGEISVAEPELLDFEMRPNLQVVAYASVPGTTSSTVYGFATVNIQLQDENDNSPRFSTGRYYAQVVEEQGLVDVVQVVAVDADSGNNGQVRYDIISGNADGVFEVDEVTGIVRTTRSLDREVQDSYNLQLHVTDLGESARRTDSCIVQVSVVDYNDHKPTLVVPSAAVAVSEATLVGSLLTTVTANDRDTVSTINFAFGSAAGYPDAHFSIDREGGKIILIKPLDYEQTRNFTLIIEASDGKYVETASIDVTVTDINDNSPVFDQQWYQTQVAELSAVNSSVITIHAEDKDSGENGLISYRVKDTSPETDLFVIDSTTGVISINKSEPFSPLSSIFYLEVEAFDHGEPPLAQSVSVRIQVKDFNNHLPVFSQSQYEGHVSESALGNFSVIIVTATDADSSPDNKNVYYRIVSGNTGGAFNIWTHSIPGEDTVGEICVAADLDREVVDVYTLTVAASNRGSPKLSSHVTVTIRVSDVNDNRPVFNQTHYLGMVKENNERSSSLVPNPVLSVYASDADSITSDLSFEIISGNDDGSFELLDCVPSSEGCALLNAKLVDFEGDTNRYGLTIQVTNLKSSKLARSTTSVIVIVEDVNEFMPEILQLSVQENIVETVKADDSLFYLTGVDNDGGYYGIAFFEIYDNGLGDVGLECPNASDIFAAEPSNGAVYATQDLDFEKCERFRFEIAACDPDQCGNRVPVEINLISVDEYPPQFIVGDQVANEPNIKFVVTYNSPVGVIVGQVNATDQDSGADGMVRFSLEENPIQALPTFVINETTGIVRLARTITDAMPRTLTLIARSTSLKATAIATVEVTGVPESELNIAGIVLGLVAGIVFIIAIILCFWCWWKKRLKRKTKQGALKEKGKGDTGNLALGDGAQCYYDDITHPKLPVTPVHREVRSVNRTQYNSRMAEPKVARNGSSGDFQLRTLVSMNNNPIRGKLRNGTGNNSSGNSQTTELNEGGSSVGTSQDLRDQSTVQKDPSHHKSDGSPEDDEVNHITSASPPSGLQSSSSSPVAEEQHRVADSGIQQDIERISENTDLTKRTSPAGSSDSVQEFGEDRRGKIYGIAMSRYPSNLKNMTDKRAKVPTSFDTLGAESQATKTNLVAFLGALDEGQTLPERPKEQLQDWTPEFQPLSSVFSEIARLREESAAIRQAAAESQATDIFADNDKLTVSATDELGHPPPLITSVPQQTTHLVNPVPIPSSVGTRSDILHGHAHFKGLYPISQPAYQQGNTGLPSAGKKHGLPPSYASKRTGNSEIAKSRYSLGSRTHVTSFPYPAANPSVPSLVTLPRSPYSHDSSLTSPAMSPSLSPSLTPLTTRSPSTSPVPKEPVRTKASAKTETIVRSRSDETNLSSEPLERMVHV